MSLSYELDKVSIVIPVYNAENYVVECINSALNQTYTNIEIITVNDGSKDRSSEILKEYSNKIKIISKQNGGTASALNVGTKAMNGEWFKWLSADDVLYPNAIEELIIAAQNLKNKKSILYSNYDIINSDGKIIDQVIEPDYNQLDVFDFNVILLDHHIGNGTTSLIHKSIIDQYGMFDETIGYKEDYELWLRYCLLHDCSLHLVSKKLAKYRVHKKQLTKENLEKSLVQSDKIRKLTLDKLDPIKREKYEFALKQYRKNKPISVRSRHTIRDIIFKVLPRSTSNRILKIYMNMKEKT